MKILILAALSVILSAPALGACIPPMHWTPAAENAYQQCLDQADAAFQAQMDALDAQQRAREAQAAAQQRNALLQQQNQIMRENQRERQSAPINMPHMPPHYTRPTRPPQNLQAMLLSAIPGTIHLSPSRPRLQQAVLRIIAHPHDKPPADNWDLAQGVTLRLPATGERYRLTYDFQLSAAFIDVWAPPGSAHPGKPILRATVCYTPISQTAIRVTLGACQ